MPTLAHEAGGKSAVTGVDEPLMGIRAQYVDLGLLGARTAAVLRRIVASSEFDDYDRTVIESAVGMLRSTADAIEFVSSGGRVGSYPNSYSFGAVALTLEATSVDEPDEDVIRSLRDLADKLCSIADSADIKDAKSILPVFSVLSNIATRSAGSPGDSVQCL